MPARMDKGSFRRSVPDLFRQFRLVRVDDGFAVHLDFVAQFFSGIVLICHGCSFGYARGSGVKAEAARLCCG